MTEICGFRDLIRIMLHVEINTPLKSSEVSFIFIGPISPEVESESWQLLSAYS